MVLGISVIFLINFDSGLDLVPLIPFKLVA